MKGRNPVFVAIAGAVGMLLLIPGIGLLVVLTGSYDVAATRGHAPVVRWAVDTTMRNSVEGQAAELQPPAPITREMLVAGAHEYAEMCAHCHAAPGRERSGWAQGMRPQPPHLTRAAREWRPREIFWIVKHGIKMTGMPAFGPTHEDEALWNVAAFVSQLPGMTAEQYAALEAEGAGGPHDH